MVTVTRDWVEFRFYRPEARQVHVVGDFNRWCQGALPMFRTPRGDWVVRVCLPAGKYKFRYWSDGQWFTDYAAFGIEYGPFGPDSCLIVPDERSAPEPAPVLGPVGTAGRAGARAAG